MSIKQILMMGVDAGHSMLFPFSDSMTRFALSFECVKLSLQQKLFDARKGQHFGLFLFGDKENQGLPYVLHNLAEPKLDSVRLCAQMATFSESNIMPGGDIFNAIKFAADTINDSAGKSTKKRMFIFSSGEGKTQYRMDDIKFLAEIINKTGVKINLIAIDFMESYDESTNKCDGGYSLNHEQETNCRLLLKLKELCPENMRIHPASVAIEIYREFRKKEVNRVAIFRGDFKILPNFTIDVASYTVCRLDKSMNFKKYSIKNNGALTPSNENNVKIQPAYQIMGDSSGVEVKGLEVMPAYKYGDSLVPMTEEIQQQFAIREDKSLELVAFTARSKIPRHCFMGHVYKVIPVGDLKNKKKFSSVILSMMELDKVALCRHIPRNHKNGVKPKLVALLPFKSSAGECFYLVDVPIKGQIREYSFRSMKKSTSSEQKLVEELMDSMDLMDLNGEGQAVKVQTLFNPTRQHLYQTLFHKVAHPGEKIPPLDPLIRNYITPEIKNLSNIQGILSTIKSAFNFKKKKLKHHQQNRVIIWSQLLKQKDLDSLSITTADTSTHIDTKKFQFQSQPITQLNPSYPMQTFNGMIAYQKRDLVGKAIAEMTIYIENKLAALTSQSNPKDNRLIEDCLAVLRNGCIKEKEESLWDEWLDRTVDRFGEDVKRRLREKGLGFLMKSNDGLYKVEHEEELMRAVMKVEYDQLD